MKYHTIIAYGLSLSGLFFIAREMDLGGLKGFRMTRNRLIALACLLLATASCLFIDLPVKDLVKGLRSPGLDGFIRVFNRMGNGDYLFPLPALLFFVFSLLGRGKTARVFGSALFAAVAAGLASQVFKHVFWRARPNITDNPLFFFALPGIVKDSGIGVARYISFPSGHTASVFGAFTALYLGIRKNRFGMLIFLAPLLTAFGRIYFGKHWTSDVVFSTGLGVTVALLVDILYPLAKRKKSPQRIKKSKDRSQKTKEKRKRKKKK